MTRRSRLRSLVVGRGRDGAQRAAQLRGGARPVGEADEGLAVLEVGRDRSRTARGSPGRPRPDRRAARRRARAASPAAPPSRRACPRPTAAPRSPRRASPRLPFARRTASVRRAMSARSGWPAASSRSSPATAGAACGLACSTSRYDANVPSRSARRVSWMPAIRSRSSSRGGRSCAARVARSRRSASTTPAQSWRASETRTSARNARSLAGSASRTAVQVAAAAAEIGDPFLLERRDLDQQANALRDVGGAIGAGVEELSPDRPRPWSGSGSARARRRPPRRSRAPPGSASAARRASWGLNRRVEAMRSARRRSHSRSSASLEAAMRAS